MNSTRREQGIFNILSTALRLFRDNGYAATTVRQISEQANVSLGMLNHYFGSKEKLGENILSLLSDYSFSQLPGNLSIEDDPILWDLVMVRLLFNYIRTHGYWDFYLDSLQNDFFFKSLEERPLMMATYLQKLYEFQTDADSLLLYSRYLPYMMEKTLVLKKESGIFPSISYEEIPYLICSTAMNHFIPEADVKERNHDSILLAEQYGRSLKNIPPEEFILDFIQNSGRF